MNAVPRKTIHRGPKDPVMNKIGEWVDRLFSTDSDLILEAGRDYNCSDKSMRQQIWRWARKHGKKISCSEEQAGRIRLGRSAA